MKTGIESFLKLLICIAASCEMLLPLEDTCIYQNVTVTPNGVPGIPVG